MFKNLLPLVVITASLCGCALLFEGEARPETASVAAAQEAVLAANLAKLQELAKTNPELIRTRDHALQQTPLHWASSVGDQDVVAWPLEQNADVNAKDGNGNTPLHVAAFMGRSQVAGSLLDRGAHVNALNDYPGPSHELAVRSCSSARLRWPAGGREYNSPTEGVCRSENGSSPI